MSKCPTIIAVVSSCTFIAIITTYTICLYAFETIRFKVQHILLKSLRNRGGGEGGKNEYMVTKRDIGGLGVEKGVL